MQERIIRLCFISYIDRIAHIKIGLYVISCDFFLFIQGKQCL